MSDTRDNLWCIFVCGPGTVIPQPDFWTAAERAIEWSKGMLESHKRDPHPLAPFMYCNVVEWPHSPASHAEGLREHGGTPEDIC